MIRAEFSGDLQSLSWSAMAFGGICGSLLGGFALSTFRIEKIFLLFSILPIIQLVSCTSVKEVLSEIPKMDQNGQGDIQDESDSSKGYYSAEKVKGQTRRRQKDSHTNGVKKAISTKYEIITHQHSSLTATWHESLKLAFFSLCRAFRQPLILR